MEDFARIAYEAYVQSCGGLSIRGDILPPWENQSPEIQGHWDVAAQAVLRAAGE